MAKRVSKKSAKLDLSKDLSMQLKARTRVRAGGTIPKAPSFGGGAAVGYGVR